MTNPLRTEFAQNLGLLLLRLALGATFLGAGLEKVHYMGVTPFVNWATGMLPDFLPKPIGQTYLYAVPFFELAVGTLLVLGLLTRTTATIATLMIISFTIAATGLKAPGSHVGLHPNLVLITAAFLLATTGAGKFSVDKAVLKTK